jgi:hypothetical protein
MWSHNSLEQTEDAPGWTHCAHGRVNNPGAFRLSIETATQFLLYGVDNSIAG